MSSEEIVNILDVNGEIIRSITREEAERDNHITENVLVFIFNTIGQIWIQKRPINKKHYPGLWDVSACGSVLSGEDRLVAAQREQFEEMGYVCGLVHVETFMNEFLDESGEIIRHRLSHLFVGISDEIPKPNQEVDEFRAVHYEELRLSVLQDPNDYIPSFLVELDKAVNAYPDILDNLQ